MHQTHEKRFLLTQVTQMVLYYKTNGFKLLGIGGYASILTAMYGGPEHYYSSSP